MKTYSTVEEQVSANDEVSEKPAPYNWLVILFIFIAYLLCAFFF
jgi:hypothetical protein